MKPPKSCIAITTCFRGFIKLLQQKLPTETHEKYWRKYLLNVLYMRSSVVYVCMIFFHISQHYKGFDRATLSREYMSRDDAQVNRERAEALFPFLEVIVLAGNAFRLVMVLIAIKRPGICHYFYAYACLLTMVKETFPIDTG